MLKSELVDVIALGNPHLSRVDVERMVNAVLDRIVEALAEGGRAELRGFGVFSVRYRRPKAGRNPRTGETVQVEEKWIPHFKTGKELQDRLNGSDRDQPSRVGFDALPRRRV